MNFVNKEHFNIFLRGLTYLGQGFQGICYLNKNNMSIYDTNLDKNFVNIVNMLSKNVISSKIFKDILEELLTSNLSVEEILKEKNISLMSDTSKLEEIIKKY